jgi:hypothetical protein
MFIVTQRTDIFFAPLGARHIAVTTRWSIGSPRYARGTKQLSVVTAIIQKSF